MYNIVGMTPEELTKEFSGQAFDYADLQKNFKKHCKDYAENLQTGVASRAVEFAAKVIYKVGPESRKIKPGQLDRTWRFNFEYQTEKHYVFVSTFKTSTYVPTDGDLEKTISVKQASLLAMDTLQRLCTISANSNEYIFTPLAGAIFSRDDIEEIAKVLNTSAANAVIMINNSCQSGGQYLPHSDGSIAIVAAFAATRNLKDENLRKSIVTKITKQYLKAQRKIDKVIIFRLAQYATGGIPADFAYEELKALIDDAISSRLKLNDLTSTEEYLSLTPMERMKFRPQETMSTRKGKTLTDKLFDLNVEELSKEAQQAILDSARTVSKGLDCQGGSKN